MTKLFRNEYRVVPYGSYWRADFRLWWFPVWFYVVNPELLHGSQEKAETICRRHAGEGTKYLGKLP